MRVITLIRQRLLLLRLQRGALAFDRRWWWWAIATIGSLAVLMASDQHRREQLNAQMRLHAQIAAGETATAVRPTSPAVRTDFTSKLGSTISAERFLSILQQTCTRANASLTSTAVAERASVPGELHAVEFNVAMKGNYDAIKLVLAEVLQRVPATTVKQLRLRQDPSRRGATEANIVFSVWAASPMRDGKAPMAASPVLTP